MDTKITKSIKNGVK